MRARKFGCIGKLRNSVTRRHLFYNQKMGLSLDEMLEYQNCRCVGKWFEVSKIDISENNFRLIRRCVMKTDIYSRAWDAVKDPDFEMKRR